MKEIRSEDGTCKSVASIPKAAYTRPTHAKVHCPHCSERGEGFRGTHELERHIARKHAAVRTGYICVDASSDGRFLSSCKHCVGKKVYGAYYNAAAHLRRAHFNPRKPRCRKGGSEEKRGGIGGGDKPAMEILKRDWICEIKIFGEVKKKGRVQKGKTVGVVRDFNDDEADGLDYEMVDAPSSYQPQTTNPDVQFDFNNLEAGAYLPTDDSFVDVSQFGATYPDPSSLSNLDEFDQYGCVTFMPPS